MPYSRTNSKERTYVFETDPAAVQRLRVFGDQVTGTYTIYSIATVDEDGNTTGTFMWSIHFDTAGEARADIYNTYLQLTRMGDDNPLTVEIRKETRLDGSANVCVFNSEGCWQAITRSITVVETIRRYG